MTECLSYPGLRTLLEKHRIQYEMDLAHSEQFVVMWNASFKTPSYTLQRYMDWTSLYHLMECQHLNSVTLLGYICGHHFTSTPSVWYSPGYIGSLTSSLNHGCCSKPSQQFIIPTCLGFVSFTLFCKRMILVLLF